MPQALHGVVLYCVKHPQYNGDGLPTKGCTTCSVIHTAVGDVTILNATASASVTREDE